MATVLDREQLPQIVHPRAHTHTQVEDDESGWTLDASEGREAARLRHAFRDYLEAFGHPASDFDAAEAVYGELVANCAHHAPGRIRVEFRWSDSTLRVTDGSDRLRAWPFSAHDPSAESTHHAYSILSALTAKVLVCRGNAGGTCASVVLPVLPAER